MKKILIALMTIIAIAGMPSVQAAKSDLPEKTDHEKVIVYLFRGHGCSHCADFLKYFTKEYPGYEDYFEIVSYESWEDETNQKLMYAVKEKIGEEADGSVPFIVIGSDYHTSGFGTSTGKEIIEEALKAYQDDNYKDLVKSVAKKEKIEGNSETLNEAASKEEIVTLDEDGNVKSGLSDGVVVGIIFGVIILGFGGLVFFSRK